MITTGFNELDHMTGGLQGGHLIMVAARPSMGKTTFAMNLLDHVCRAEERNALIISDKMTTDEFIERYLKLQSRKAVDESDRNLVVDEMHPITVNTIKNRVEMLKKPELIVVDYLELMDSDKNYADTRMTEITEILQGLKELAVLYEIPMVVLSQLPRSYENYNDHRSIISDISHKKESVNSFDVILYLYRDSYYQEREDVKSEQSAEIIVARHPCIKELPVTTHLMFDYDKGFYNM